MLIYLCHFFTAIVGKVQLLVIMYMKINVSLRFVYLVIMYKFFIVNIDLKIRSYPGAEWWAQQFGKSLPFLSWVPFIDGKAFWIFQILLNEARNRNSTHEMIAFNILQCVPVYSIYGDHTRNILYCCRVFNLSFFFPYFRNSNIQSRTVSNDSFRCYTNNHIQVRISSYLTSLNSEPFTFLSHEALYFNIVLSS